MKHKSNKLRWRWWWLLPVQRHCLPSTIHFTIIIALSSITNLVAGTGQNTGTAVENLDEINVLDESRGVGGRSFKGTRLVKIADADSDTGRYLDDGTRFYSNVVNRTGLNSDSDRTRYELANQHTGLGTRPERIRVQAGLNVEDQGPILGVGRNRTHLISTDRTHLQAGPASVDRILIHGDAERTRVSSGGLSSTDRSHASSPSLDETLRGYVTSLDRDLGSSGSSNILTGSVIRTNSDNNDWLHSDLDRSIVHTGNGLGGANRVHSATANLDRNVVRTSSGSLDSSIGPAISDRGVLHTISANLDRNVLHTGPALADRVHSTSADLDRNIVHTGHSGVGPSTTGSVRPADRNAAGSSSSSNSDRSGRLQSGPVRSNTDSSNLDRSNLFATVSGPGSTRIGHTGTAVEADLASVERPIIKANLADEQARIKADLASEEEAKRHAQNVVRLAATDQLESEIITNRTRAYLSCESGEMIVKINFTEPFRGVGYSDYDRSSPCKFYGDGSRYYEMRLPLKGCGTKQEAPRIFINNIILRFHRSLELEEDEIKTIICRYPPPLAPPPPLIAAPILESPPPPAPIVPAKLSEVELLLIVSALLFLTLLLLGIGIGYYCLKRRNIKVVRKFPPSSPPSEFTYVPPIPRVSLSSSETITSDYPSEVSDERRSILSETSTIRRDHYRFENLGYIPEHKAFGYDDLFRSGQHLIDEDIDVTRQNVIAPPVPLLGSKQVDDRFVTNASHTDIDDDIERGRVVAPKKPKITTIITDDYFVTPTTTTEVIEDITTQRLIVPPLKPVTAKMLDDTFITPESETMVVDESSTQKVFGVGPKITTETSDDLYGHEERDTEVIEESSTQRLHHRPKQPTVKEVDDYYRHREEDTELLSSTINHYQAPRRDTFDVYEIDEIVDVSSERYGPSATTRTIQTDDDEFVTHTGDVEESIDHTSHRVIGGKKPKILVKNIDDFYVTNITETETQEQIVKTGRSMPNLLLEVDYEEEEEEEARISRFDVKMRSVPIKPTVTTSSVEETTHYTESILRVVDNPPFDRVKEVEAHLPAPKRDKLRKVILTDETFVTLLIESSTVEEYTERIENHPTYGPLFEPPAWNVIFRLLTLPEVARKKPKNRKYPITDSIRSYKSGYSAHEMRSVTEEDVSFSRTRLSESHYIPLPDYDDGPARVETSWASPKADKFDPYSRDSPIVAAFGRGRKPRQRVSPDQPTTTTSSSFTSSAFGARHLANPYDPYSSASPSIRRRLQEYGAHRPYSPDIDALSLEPSTSSRSRTYYSSGLAARHLEEHEEIKSTTETNVYDWKRYS